MKENNDKTKDCYVGLWKENCNAMVQKSRILHALTKEFPMSAIKILDIYLAKINSHDEEKRTVIFEKGELEHALGVTRISKTDLKKRIRALFGGVEISNSNDENKAKMIALFEQADAIKDENGLWQITLTCSPEAKKYIFNIDNIGYLRYRLKYAAKLYSMYSYNLYLYLEDNKFRKKWSISIEELKEMLNCNKDTYKQYYRFNDLILKKCYKDIQEKTDIEYTYTAKKGGRGIVGVQFETNSCPKASFGDIDPNKKTTEQQQENNQEKPLWQEVLEEFNLEFTNEEIEALRQALVCIPDNKLPICDWVGGDIEIRRYHYIGEKVSEMKARPKVKHYYAYLLKILKNDATSAQEKTPTGKNNTSSFDIDEIEKLVEEKYRTMT